MSKVKQFIKGQEEIFWDIAKKVIDGCETYLEFEKLLEINANEYIPYRNWDEELQMEVSDFWYDYHFDNGDIDKVNQVINMMVN